MKTESLSLTVDARERTENFDERERKIVQSHRVKKNKKFLFSYRRFVALMCPSIRCMYIICITRCVAISLSPCVCYAISSYRSLCTPMYVLHSFNTVCFYLLYICVFFPFICGCVYNLACAHNPRDSSSWQ